MRLNLLPFEICAVVLCIGIKIYSFHNFDVGNNNMQTWPFHKQHVFYSTSMQVSILLELSHSALQISREL